MMKSWQFFAVLLLSVLCLGLSVALVAMARSNQQLQQDLQERQVQLNSGVLGSQAQQIANSVLQDMGRASTSNEPMRLLLVKYGYTVAAGTQASDVPPPAQKEPVKEGPR